MKKFLFLTVVSIIISHSISASVIAPPLETPVMYEIGHGVKLPMEKILTLTPKEYKELTGHRLGLVKSIMLKTIQKKLKKHPDADGNKSQVAAALLCFFLGGLGIHRFYLGYTWQGVVQLLTAGGLGIWALIDFVRIITGDLKPKNGEYRNKM
jgi:TM2 domain-containing membrane protein YozV